ncbi:hypothetical protein [Leucobacter sp. G161]|uniref:hypothetical protein n=1 Tax=Leucobacter sp. G161 TaxID=663704 RepID=UPI00073CD081|nr:hypothetical protein [Leucobacter sp. G161]KUF08557.1 hypothetical protein AUL38_00130 [Leucobacter sp. G161]
MLPARKKYAFGPLFIVLGAIATLATILVAVLPVVTWVNSNAIWLPWLVVAALVAAVMLLIARVTAAKEEIVIADETIVTEVEKARQTTEGLNKARADADAAKSDAEKAKAMARAAVEQTETDRVAAAAAEADAAETRAALESLRSASAALSEPDRDLARHLFEYASDGELLTMLGSFFPYQIPQGPVRLIDELSELPVIRAARNAELERHFGQLAEAARTWRLKFMRVASTDGDHFNTKLDRHVTDAAYKQHTAMTNELGDAGFDLHEKLLAYQRYYASL